jgi:hypothetical protein
MGTTAVFEHGYSGYRIRVLRIFPKMSFEPQTTQAVRKNGSDSDAADAWDKKENR